MNYVSLGPKNQTKDFSFQIFGGKRKKIEKQYIMEIIILI